MSSDLQRATNRANAAKSTGPRTRHGKSRASKNAHKHGFSMSLEGTDEVEAMARLIAGGRDDILSLARVAGEAQLQLNKLRRYKTVLMDAAAIASRGNDLLIESPHIDDRYVQIIPSLIKQLAACERYERRALSRRNKALRCLQPLSSISCNTTPTSDALDAAPHEPPV